MRLKWITAAWVLMAAIAGAQVASHAPSSVAAAPSPASARLMDSTIFQVADRPVARVNGVVLTDRDLLREMYAIFPYARQHNGFPRGMEPEIRKGALQMIIFDELVYQEAVRRKIVIPAVRVNRAAGAFRKQFPSDDVYRQFLQIECKGSTQVLRERVRRSLMIEALMNAEVHDRARLTPAQVKAYYERNPKQFYRAEKFSIQTISIIPPNNAGAEVQKEARKRADNALRQAKGTKSYREFGLLAEKLSDDDWHVNMGDRHEVDAATLPPPLVEAARKMKPGDISDLMQFGPNYTLFRMNSHTPAGRTSFEEVKGKLQTELQNSKMNQLRSDLNRRLHKDAKIELL